MNKPYINGVLHYKRCDFFWTTYLIMARANTKIGDVFCVTIEGKGKKYLQYIISDVLQLNSDVIRAFKKIYPLNEEPVLSEIVKDEIDFYAHCVTKWGIQLGYWEKVGNNAELGKTDHILFRDTSDYGKQVPISENWYVWHINDENVTMVGNLKGHNRISEIGVVFPPDCILHRMKTGEYDFKYPDFI